ncbi:hypothetical protein [Miniphocaeibacter massiliensis]|uniref:hypothetical protein n=1 Tax=Miniphocaeibacter massiliensis TaxID=2041841 RepID=UPI000C1BB579|nr:hypothetical protein [Miniphocaeibacter massiliensis]
MAINLDKELSSIIDEYVSGVRSGLDNLGAEVAEKGLKEIKKLAPRDRPKYYKGFSITTQYLGVNNTFVLHNEKIPSLTHLTEFGAATRSGGRTSATPHFAPTEKLMVEEYEKGVKKLLENE